MKCYFFGMNRVLKTSLVASIGLCFAAPAAMADAAAERVLEKARIASTVQMQDLDGYINKNGKKTPLKLYLRRENIQFQFWTGKEWSKFHMELKDGGGRLFELRGGKTFKFDKKKLTESIMDTDLTYEDLAMTFLYWKNAKIERQELVKTSKCDVLRLERANGAGAYDIVYAWVNQKFGALMKVVGYDSQGRRLKEFGVEKLMKVKNGWTLKRMKVSRYDPNTKKLLGKTYLDFKEPKKVNQPLQ